MEERRRGEREQTGTQQKANAVKACLCTPMSVWSCQGSLESCLHIPWPFSCVDCLPVAGHRDTADARGTTSSGLLWPLEVDSKRNSELQAFASEQALSVLRIAAIRYSLSGWKAGPSSIVDERRGGLRRWLPHCSAASACHSRTDLALIVKRYQRVSQLRPCSVCGERSRSEV